MNTGNDRAPQLYGEVGARCRQHAVIGIDLIIDHIDAAHKSDLAIDHGELTVHAPQALSAPKKRAGLGPKNLDSDPCGLQVLA